MIISYHFYLIRMMRLYIQLSIVCIAKFVSQINDLSNENFANKYNYGKELERLKENIFLIWFKENGEKMREINTSKEDVLDFFAFNKNINII